MRVSEDSENRFTAVNSKHARACSGLKSDCEAVTTGKLLKNPRTAVRPKVLVARGMLSQVCSTLGLLPSKAHSNTASNAIHRQHTVLHSRQQPRGPLQFRQRARHTLSSSLQ